MSHFIHYKYKPKILEHIKYNSILKKYLYSFSQSNDLQNLILYGPSGTGKKTFILCFLNQYFNNDNIIYNTNTFNYTLSNNYKIHYKSSSYHYQINLLDNYKNNILIIQELINYLIQSKSIVNDYIIIILYNIEKLQNNINLLKIIMEKYSHVKFICSSKKRFSELELAIQLRTEKISEFELLKISLIINKQDKLNLSNELIISTVKNSSNNLNILLNSIQSIINDTENNNNLLNDICDILEKKNINDYPKIKQHLNKIIIFKSYDLNYIIEYIYSKILHLIPNKSIFIYELTKIIKINLNSTIVQDIITLDTFIFLIYKSFK
tara:strand:- start:2175 stop:3143 length:969 start_codon:yes stop_codon:yes gene_type:complete